MTAPSPLTTIPFEQALQELETIVRLLEEGKVPLEDAIKAYERGSQLRVHCETLLKSARTKIEEIVQHKDGTISTKPSPLQETIPADEAE